MTIVSPRENESADAAVHRTQDITSERYWLNYGGKNRGLTEPMHQVYKLKRDHLQMV